MRKHHKKTFFCTLLNIFFVCLIVYYIHQFLPTFSGQPQHLLGEKLKTEQTTYTIGKLGLLLFFGA